MQRKKRLGDLLVDDGLLTEEQLKKALIEQKKADLKLGQYLVRSGMVNESQIVDVVSKQVKIEKYSSAKYPVNMELAGLITAETSRKYQVIPLRKKGSLLTIAMVDPLDIMAMDAIEVDTNCEVEAVICTEQDFKLLTNHLFGTYSDMDGVMEKLDQQGSADKESAKTDARTGTFEEYEVSSLQDMAEEAPVIRLVNSLLTQAIREGTSDIHISPEKNYIQVRFRIDGKLQEVPAPPKNMFLSIVSRLKILSNLDISVSRIPQDGRFTIKTQNKEINIRVSTLPTIYGENVVLRLLDTSGGIYSLEALGVSPENCQTIQSMVQKPYGMILSSGPTGSGKSTTLFSILKILNQPDVNIITLEDPVEYRMEKIRQVQLNTKAGMTFASGLRSILRQDPDVVMVGEIRDSETAGIAVQAALTGHRVLSTVHTNDAAGAITRFIDMGIEPFLVSSVMLVTIAQRLIRKICPECMETYAPSASALNYWSLSQEEGIRFVRGRGCFNCKETGYKGRSGLYEVLKIDPMVQDMIVKGMTAQDIAREAHAHGQLKTLQDDAVTKIKAGITTIEEATSAVMG